MEEREGENRRRLMEGGRERERDERQRVVGGRERERRDEEPDSHCVVMVRGCCPATGKIGAVP